MKFAKKSKYYIKGRGYKLPENTIEITSDGWCAHPMFQLIKYKFLQSEAKTFFEQNKPCKSAFVTLSHDDLKQKAKEDESKFCRGVPMEVMQTIKNWKLANRAPYDNSFYNRSSGVSWEHTPDETIRIADHWNFETAYDNKIHCILDTTQEYITGIWIMAKYSKELGIYKELHRWEISEPNIECQDD